MNTGFAVLSRYIINALYQTGKYEIAEFGSYAKTSDPRAMQIPWKFYGAIPEDHQTDAKQRYNQSVYGQFGETLFPHVCLDFRPDIVCDVRDFWMCNFEAQSPFRKYFKLLWMPTVDGEPQKEEWLDSYSHADAIITYSEYGKRTIERESKTKVNIVGVGKPGVAHEVFRPLSKAAVRKTLGIPEDENIILTVMRNQRRKLFPDLINDFKAFLLHCVKNDRLDIATKTKLYLHTSYPDVGFDIARLIMQSGVSQSIYVTYMCKNCGKFYASRFVGEVAVCRHCGSISAFMPNTQHGVTRENLADIYNAADLYIQYSICEGFGCPIAEAKACGIPAMSIAYSASAEQVEAPGCIALKVGKFFYEPVIETEQMRALPDSKDTVAKLYGFFTSELATKKAMGHSAMKDALENYTLARCAKVFEKALDELYTPPQDGTWLNPQPIHVPMDTRVPHGFESNSQFLDHCIHNIIGDDSLKQSYFKTERLKALNVGYIGAKTGPSNMQRRPYGTQEAIQEMIVIAQNIQGHEKMRLDKFFNNESKLNWTQV
ncbi:MAG: glycosyltransferase [Clostridia bacterium]